MGLIFTYGLNWCAAGACLITMIVNFANGSIAIGVLMLVLMIINSLLGLNNGRILGEQLGGGYR